MDHNIIELSSDDIFCLNSLIRDLAVRGHMDDIFRYSGDADVKWKIIGQYVAVYLETYYYTYDFRLFICQGEAFYDLNMGLEPHCENGFYRCLYDYSIDIDEIGTLRYYADENWKEEFQKAAREFLERG